MGDLTDVDQWLTKSTDAVILLRRVALWGVPSDPAWTFSYWDLASAIQVVSDASAPWPRLQLELTTRLQGEGRQLSRFVLHVGEVLALSAVQEYPELHRLREPPSARDIAMAREMRIPRGVDPTSAYGIPSVPGTWD